MVKTLDIEHFGEHYFLLILHENNDKQITQMQMYSDSDALYYLQTWFS